MMDSDDDDDEATIRDDASWADFAFGQSMRDNTFKQSVGNSGNKNKSFKKLNLLQKNTKSNVRVEQSQSALSNTLKAEKQSQSDDRVQERSTVQPTTEERKVKKLSPKKALWVEGNEENLSYKVSELEQLA